VSQYDAIIADLKNVLTVMADADGKQAFGDRVGVYDDLESFLDVSENITAKTAGIIVPAGPTRIPPLSNDEDYAQRLPGSICFSMLVKRKLGEDEKAAMLAVQSLSDLIRAAVMADPSRGGNAGLINTGGSLVNGTSVDGETRFAAGVSNKAVYTAEIPFTVGWWVARTDA
jgi:hypothetical protein